MKNYFPNLEKMYEDSDLFMKREMEFFKKIEENIKLRKLYKKGKKLK